MTSIIRMIRPTMMYGYKCWAMKKVYNRKLKFARMLQLIRCSTRHRTRSCRARTFFLTTTVLLITTSYINKLPPVARCNATNILQHRYKTNPQSPNVTTKNSNLTECNDLSIQPPNVELEVVPITDKLSSNLVCRIGLDLKRFGFQFHSNLMFGSNDWLNSKSQEMKSHKHRISKSYQGGWYFLGFHRIRV